VHCSPCHAPPCRCVLSSRLTHLLRVQARKRVAGRVQKLRSERRELLSSMRDRGLNGGGGSGGKQAASSAVTGSSAAQTATADRSRSVELGAMDHVAGAAAHMLDAGSGSGGDPHTSAASAEVAAALQVHARYEAAHERPKANAQHAALSSAAKVPLQWSRPWDVFIGCT
jgi:hypothetical protein